MLVTLVGQRYGQMDKWTDRWTIRLHVHVQDAPNGLSGRGHKTK